MQLRSVKDIKNIKNKRVLLRTDFNVPIQDSKIEKNEDTRIKSALPTIKYLKKRGAVIIILSHLGRPNGRVINKLRLDPIAKRLSVLLKEKVHKLNDIIGKAVIKTIKNAKPGKVIMLENIRFHPGEEKNCKRLAKRLANYADIYINDAFSNCHRRHSSMVAITEYLPSFAGFLLEQEVKVINQFLKASKRPLTAIIGGSKISTKITLIRNLLKLADDVLLAGALANTVLKAKGVAVGKSIVEEKMVSKLKKIKLTNIKLHIPVDVIVAKSISKRAQGKIRAVANVKNNEYILDIGTDTTALFRYIIRQSKSIIWNGPMGMIELPQFSIGTIAIINAVLHSRAKIIIGGGDTVKIFEKFFAEFISKKPNIYISTGGGAMLKFIENNNLPAIKPLLTK